MLTKTPLWYFFFYLNFERFRVVDKKYLPNRLMFTSGDIISKEKSSKLLKNFEKCGVKFNIKFIKSENEESQHFENQQNYIEIHPIFENFFLFKRLLI
jgi:hypothetical protein